MRISSIDSLLARDDSQAWIARHGRPAVVAALRAAAADVRAELVKGGDSAAGDAIDARVAALASGRLSTRARSSLRPVINATGVVLHTKLGRAPIGRAALERMAETGAGYASVEYDLEAGARGRRR